jgi:Family of unknown function (DUF5360)
MPRSLRISLLLTDTGFILYWAVTALVAMGAISVPADWLFKDYHDANIVAWNWSFMPLDLLASATGIAAIWHSRRGESWRGVAIVSMTLTFCAGFMALSFWTFQRSFDLSWWLPNAALTLWPLFFARKIRQQP